MASIQHDAGSLDFAATQPHPGKRLTEEEFVAWCDEDTRAEWVDGEVIIMAAASWVHIRISQFLTALLEDFARARNLGQVGGIEFSVRLNNKRRRLPDILFIANKRLNKLCPNHLEGPPNLIIEVVSPDSVDRDWREKHLEYQSAGVEEYWIVDPLDQRAKAFALGANNAYQDIEPVDGKIASAVVPGFYLRPEWLWQTPLPATPAVLAELLAS